MLSKIDRLKIRDYLAKRNDIFVAYLFGSQASGKANKLSDIDVAVLFDNNINSLDRFEKKLEIAGEIGHILKSNDVEAIDLNSAHVALRFSAIEFRDILFEGDSFARSIFEADTMSRFQDYSYFIKTNTLNSLSSISHMNA